MSVTPKIGRQYLTRNGRVTIPVYDQDHPFYPIGGRFLDDPPYRRRSWARDGRYSIVPGQSHDLDFIEELPDATEQKSRDVDDLQRAIDKAMADWRPHLVAVEVHEDFCAPTHIHIKTGNKYRLVSSGILKETMTPVIIYAAADGTTWVRAADEFAHRFKPIEKEAPPEVPLTGSIANAAREVAETIEKAKAHG